jgi:hypothetical protein
MEVAEQHTDKVAIVEIKRRIEINTAKAFAERLTCCRKSIG